MAAPEIAPEEDSFSLCLQALPRDVVERIVILLPDPSALAATSRAAAALLGQEALLLAWWDEHRPRSSPGEDDDRHPSHALLYWRRVHSLGMPQLAALLLRQASRGVSTSAQSEAHATAKQLPDAGDALGCITTVLPRSEQLLLLYAAHAGHVPLLNAALAALPAQPPQLQLRWGEEHAQADLIRAAAHAAVRGGSVAALQALFAAIEARGAPSDVPQLANQLVEFAANAGECSSTACIAALLQRCEPPEPKPADEEASKFIVQGACGDMYGWHSGMLEAAVQSGNAVAARALVESGEVNDEGRHESMFAALAIGHSRMLPLLQPPSMSNAAAAMMYSDSLEHFDGLRDDVSKHLAYLPQAMWALRNNHAAAQGLYTEGLHLTIMSDSVETLQELWTLFGTHPRYLRILCVYLVKAMSDEGAWPHPKIASWVLTNAIPELREHMPPQALQEVWRIALQHGHWELCEALIPTASEQLGLGGAVPFEQPLAELAAAPVQQHTQIAAPAQQQTSTAAAAAAAAACDEQPTPAAADQQLAPAAMSVRQPNTTAIAASMQAQQPASASASSQQPNAAAPAPAPPPADPWQRELRQGLLLRAVQRGDVDAARDAANAIARHDDHDDAFHAFKQALYCTAEVASADAAESIVKMLAAEVDFSVGLSKVAMYKLIMPYGGRLMAAFCEAQPGWVESLDAADNVNLLCLWMASEQGSADAAWRWLCGDAGIAPAPLCELLLRHWTVTNGMLASVRVLLRRAVALCNSDAEVTASGVQVGAVEVGSSGAPGGSSRADGHGSSSALADSNGSIEDGERDGNSKDGGDASSSSSSLPAGMQQLTAPFLTQVLWSGYPDVLHAMLDFVDCCNPSTTAN